jgi:hypothetical protein
MKNILLITLFALLTLNACSNADSKKTVDSGKEEVLYQIKDGQFTEWYPGKKTSEV